MVAMVTRSRRPDRRQLVLPIPAAVPPPPTDGPERLGDVLARIMARIERPARPLPPAARRRIMPRG